MDDRTMAEADKLACVTAKIKLNRMRLPPHICHKELIQEVRLRVVEAILRRYDPNKSSIKTYVKHQVPGAIIDALRKQEGYSRYSSLRQIFSLEASSPTYDIEDRSINIAEGIDREKLANFVKRLLIDTLPPIELKIATLLFFEGKYPREIEHLFSFGECRIYQIRREILAKLRARLHLMGVQRIDQLVI